MELKNIHNRKDFLKINEVFGATGGGVGSNDGFASTGKLKGALFIDAGNIWMTHKDATQPGADFELNRFVGEMAIGAGVGFRFDFSFFVLRLDAAVKVRDPQNPANQRWVINDIHPNTINLNLGIGYPF